MPLAANAVPMILQQAATARGDTAGIDSVVVQSPLPRGAAALVRFLFNSVPQWVQIAGVFVSAIVAAIVLVILWRRRVQISGWFRAKSRGWKLGFAAMLVLVLSGAGFAGMKSWNFMMHDNSFCTGCHVMETPFRRFTAGEHSDLSCHDCHRQGILASARQVYQWVAERPERIGSHGPVPNAVCAECHSLRDADSSWKRISATAGHAVHLNPNSPGMRQLECVACHGEAVHRFESAEKTCAQSGCHDQLKIELGKMAGQTALHCSTCHVFSAAAIETNPTDSARAALVPNEKQCLECHEMREQMKAFKPDDDPHKGVCGSCHNPHTQTTPAGAFQSCATSGCHAPSDSLTAQHRSIRGHKLATCGACHAAHTWKTGRTECESCHTGISDPAVRVRRPPGAGDDPQSHAQALKSAPAVTPERRYHSAPSGRSPTAHRFIPASWSDSRQAGMAFAPHPVGRAQRRSANGEVALAQARDTARFEHARHRSVRCLACHTQSIEQVGLKASARECTACHHANTAIGNACESCHQRSELTGAHAVAASVALTVWPAPRTRTLSFAHEQHAGVACADCHGSTLRRTVEKTCASCHTDHHVATRTCASCHPPARETHTRALHVTGCGGSGCHMQETTAAITPARAVCVACHVEQVEHKPGRECAPCHLSVWRPSTAPASP